MATQAQPIPGRLVRQEHAIEKPPSGIIPQLFTVIARPRFFFRVMPRGRSWIVAAILMLVVIGFTATRQVSSTTRSLVSPTTAQTQALGGQGGFGAGRNANRGQTGATTDQTTAETSTTGTAAQTAATPDAASGSGRNFAAPANTTTNQTSAAAATPSAETDTTTTGTGRNFAAPANAQTATGGAATTGAATTAQTTTGGTTASSAQTAATGGAAAAQTGTGGAQTTAGASTLGATGAAGATTTDTTAQTPLTTSTTLMSALLAAGSILIMWIGQAVLLSLVPMLRGFKPQFGRALQIAVWATVPLAIMLMLRQIYFAAGGTGGMTGLSLLLTRWSGYASLPELAQRVLTTFMSNLSLFWIWGLLLLYFGAREALRGRRWTAIVVIAMWVTLSTVIPALIAQPVTNVVPRSSTTQTTTATTGTTTTRTTTTTGAATQFGGAAPAGGFAGGNLGGGNNRTTTTNRGG